MIEFYAGAREALRPLFELAEDSTTRLGSTSTPGAHWSRQAVVKSSAIADS